MWKRLFFDRFRFRFHTYRFRFHRHRQKTRKRPLTIFFNFCGSVACLLLHFIILRDKNLHLLQLLYLLRLSLLFRTTLCFSNSDIRSVVECRAVLSFDRVTSSLLNDFDIPTLFYHSSSSRSYPDISFAFFSLALSCSWEVLQNLCCNHYQFFNRPSFSPTNVSLF